MVSDTKARVAEASLRAERRVVDALARGLASNLIAEP
jgi:hypothetical protein